MMEPMIESILMSMGIDIDPDRVHVDWSPAKLIEHAVSHHEGYLTSTGSLSVSTGAFTGRSPEYRYLVDAGDADKNINWNSKTNKPIDEATYKRVRKNVARYMSQRRHLFIVRGYAGADRKYARKVMVVCERAHQALFIRQMLVRPTEDELEQFGRPDISVYAAPTYVCASDRDGLQPAAVILDMNHKKIVVAGTGYCGEIKKAIFTMMNYLLPIEDGVLPMHCSANVDPKTGKTAILFGLSGTGKTTLSADPERLLIGDDEHGWSPRGIFNIEGGCYAKTIDLTREREPDIFDAIRFGSVSENVKLDRKSRAPIYSDSSITENGRAAYPIEHIERVVESGVGQSPSVVLFLTADAYGVLPPISRLSREEAMFHFLTGYTAKVAGTEVGIVEPTPTFSALFGEPFMPLDHMVYAYLLGEKITRHNTRVYLVNTGWTGGPYGVGHRIALSHTRALVRAAMDGSIDDAGYRRDAIFGVDVPRECLGVPTQLLNPRDTWENPEEYDKAAQKLADLFEENFQKRYPGVSLEDLARPRDAE